MGDIFQNPEPEKVVAQPQSKTDVAVASLLTLVLWILMLCVPAILFIVYRYALSGGGI